MSRRFNRRPPTEVERTARRQADRERLEEAARALLTGEGWQRWVKVRASNGLARYSLRNQWLIALDCHARGITPTYVAGFRAFLTLNRSVRKGETALKILAPVVVKQPDTATRISRSGSASARWRSSTSPRPSRCAARRRFR
jgi:antirestriction factor ArdC-like protein